MNHGPLKLDCHCATLRQAARAVTAIYDARLARHGVRVTQFTILKALFRADPTSMRALSDALLLDQTTLSRTLATLRSRALVRSQPDATDRRVHLWCLTRTGEALYETCLPDWQAAQCDLERQGGKPDLQAFSDDIYRLTEALAG
ncbi:winged helix-turn-helix transcriptional regulator [Burkholderia sp. Ac-20379]|nr:winged helix-turn-helix transcriptional regulator [Burkholderia sp. Ac-20379]